MEQRETIRRFCIAPMMDWTDRHCRVLHRLISKHAYLYTEMQVDRAIIHGTRARLLKFSECEHPLALQIGGSDPETLAEAALIGEAAGYDEINLNIGCPSDRVFQGEFGARLMADPEKTACCVEVLKNSVQIPVTVKCRLGIDQQNVEETLPGFLEKVSQSGCQTFIIHARKAWLKGISPKENRTVPPLNYALVREMKQQFPNLEIILNGGLETLDQALKEGQGCDGVMLGRSVYKNPWLLSEVDQKFYSGFIDELKEKKQKPKDQKRLCDIVNAYQLYAESCLAEGVSLRALIRPALGLIQGRKGARNWRRILTEQAGQKGKQAEIFTEALEVIDWEAHI